jgi:hypothetical protein
MCTLGSISEYKLSMAKSANYWNQTIIGTFYLNPLSHIVRGEVDGQHRVAAETSAGYFFKTHIFWIVFYTVYFLWQSVKLN